MGENFENIPDKTGRKFEKFVELVAHLRSEKGCEWDRQQTMESMKPHLREETEEVIEAIEDEDMAGVCEELGDLLLHVVFFTRMAEERDLFDIDEVLNGIHEKIVRRHPHVFDDLEVENTEEILDNWKKIKENEKN
ncbi:MAG: MazG nucleotide pyrophosphohydrolase domain-containing protein [bacterium]